MEYTKQTWTAPTGTGLSRYAKSGETDTHIELALDPVNLTNTPTPITAARLNHMEEGIAKATAISPNDSRVKTALNASGEAPIYACRAWVNFKGTGTVAIRASGNVSSITDNGVGDYGVNFTTAMPDANYSLSANGENSAGPSEHVGISPLSLSSTSCSVLFQNTSTKPRDSSKASLAFFR